MAAMVVPMVVRRQQWPQSSMESSVRVYDSFTPPSRLLGNDLRYRYSRERQRPNEARLLQSTGVLHTVGLPRSTDARSIPYRSQDNSVVQACVSLRAQRARLTQ